MSILFLALGLAAGWFIATYCWKWKVDFAWTEGYFLGLRNGKGTVGIERDAKGRFRRASL